MGVSFRRARQRHLPKRRLGRWRGSTRVSESLMSVMRVKKRTEVIGGVLPAEEARLDFFAYLGTTVHSSHPLGLERAHITIYASWGPGLLRESSHLVL